MVRLFKVTTKFTGKNLISRKNLSIMSTRISTFLFLSICFTISACSGTKVMSPEKTDRELTVDGNLSGWNLGSSLLHESESVNYYVTHTDDFLYLYVDVRSPSKNNAMKQSGFIVYLSNSEDDRKKIGISYPAGTFNLLRNNNPGEYQSFTRDPEWASKPGNRTLLEDLEKEVFERPMIVERYDGGSSTQRGFVGMDQLEVDGIQIAINQDRRLIGLEMKIPLNESSVYTLNKEENIWLGLEIDPPNFRIANEYDSSRNNQRMGGQNQRVRQSQGNQRSNLRRSLGQYEQWFKLNLN